MDKKIFQEHTDEQRLQMLKDNASSLLEDYGYEKPLTDQQVKDLMKDLKNKIANCVSELRKEKLNKSREMKAYTERIKDLEKTLDTSSEELEKRTTYACELCYEIIDYDEKMVGIYNKDGILVDERTATLKELGTTRNMFAEQKKTGTNN